MASDIQRQEGRDSALSKLNVAIDALNLAKDICSVAPAQAAFGAASTLLAMIRVRGARFLGDRFQTWLSPGHHGQ